MLSLTIFLHRKVSWNLEGYIPIFPETGKFPEKSYISGTSFNVWQYLGIIMKLNIALRSCPLSVLIYQIVINVISSWIDLPHQVKTQYLHLRFHANYFLLPWNIPEEIRRQSMLFHKKRQYLPYQTYVHTIFYHSSGLTSNLMINGSIYYVSYLQILHFYLRQQRLTISLICTGCYAYWCNTW